MRNIEYYWGHIAKVGEGQEAMVSLANIRFLHCRGQMVPLSYKLKLIAKKSTSYRSEFDSRGSSTPLGRWPGEYICIYIYIYIYIHMLSREILWINTAMWPISKNYAFSKELVKVRRLAHPLAFAPAQRVYAHHT